MELITHSRLRTFRDCQRKHLYMYEMGVRPSQDADPLRFGRLFDDATSAWDRGGSDLDAALAIANKATDPFEGAKARALLRGYHERWKNTRESEEVLAVQPQFEMPLVNPATGRRSKFWNLAGKLDAIVRSDEGRTYVLERKTTSEVITPGADYWKRLRLDGQVSIYFDGADFLGHDVAGCIYDVTAKPGLRPLQVGLRRKTAETPLEYEIRILEDIIKDPTGYYGRAMVVRLEKELADARWDAWQMAKQIRTGRRDDHAPKNPEACLRFSVCPFLRVCCGEAALNDPGFKLTDKHPELERGA